MSTKKIIIGARGSLLSVCQAESVIKLLKKEFPQYLFSLKKITTTGDKVKDWQRQDKGIFVKEIEEALLANAIDLAVHSMKDLPCSIPPGLKLAAVTKRESPYDVLVTKEKITLSKLKKGALIGTSSLRRIAQLLHWRPDLRIEDLRGNLDTRIRKLKTAQFEAIVVAQAGLKRLGISGVFLQRLPLKIILPAVGQGALGIEARENDKAILKIVEKINDENSFLCLKCERIFLEEIGGGCRLPLGALVTIKKKRISLDAAAISPDGRKIVRLKQTDSLDKLEALGKRVAKIILARGGEEILADAKK